MRPAEVVVTSRRPTLTSEWLGPMPRHASKSSKSRHKPSRAVEREQTPAHQSAPKKEIQKSSEKAKESERYLQEDAYLTGLAAARPPLTVTWSEASVPEFIAIELRAIHHFSKLGLLDRKTNRYPKRDDVVEYYKQQRLSDGSLISPRRARELAPNLRPVEARKGGNQKMRREG